MPTFQETLQEERLHIAALRAEVRSAWNAACAHEGIPSETEFAAWSESNPHAETYNRAMTAYLSYRKGANV